jgi:phosphatidylglycerophosphate synthase
MMKTTFRKEGVLFMFDRAALKLTKPLVDYLARRIHAAGYNAEQLTFAAFGFGMTSALLIALGHSYVAIAPLLIGRVLDGLDGAVARLTSPSDRGAFLDISLDFLFYAAVPLAFATVDPVAASVLLAAFIGTGTSFLAYAIIAEKLGDTNAAYPTKSFYYLGGLTEGAETVSCFVLMCLWPQNFARFAYVFSALCCVTTITRIYAGWKRFK